MTRGICPSTLTKAINLGCSAFLFFVVSMVIATVNYYKITKYNTITRTISDLEGLKLIRRLTIEASWQHIHRDLQNNSLLAKTLQQHMA